MGADASAAKLDPDKLAQPERWTLRCGAHDIDVEGATPTNGSSGGMPSYQELLYEAGRFELEPDLSVEVASPEDIEHYAHLRRTGSPPEIKVIRQQRQEQSPEDSPAEQKGSPAEQTDSPAEQKRG